MRINSDQQKSTSYKFNVYEGSIKVGRGYLYLIRNGFHKKPYGLLEDVFIQKKYRKKGYGTKLVEHIIFVAKELGCYKMVATSRVSRRFVHAFYKKLGFRKYGVEFRLDF